MDMMRLSGSPGAVPGARTSRHGLFLSESPAGPRRAGAAIWSDRESREMRVVQSRGASA